MLPFAINLVSNLIFTPIQFGMRNLPLAAADILIVWVTIIWMVVVVWKHSRFVSLETMKFKERFRHFMPESGKKADLMFVQHMVASLKSMARWRWSCRTACCFEAAKRKPVVSSSSKTAFWKR